MASAPSIAALFSGLSSLCSRFRRCRRPAAHELGRRGEKLAARWLQRHGFRILYRNYRTRYGGEIDLVCRDKAAKTLVFVEVKTRSSLAFGHPAEAIRPEQKERIIRGARRWLRLLEEGETRILYRFDVVEVFFLQGEPYLNHIPNAFQVPQNFLG